MNSKHTKKLEKPRSPDGMQFFHAAFAKFGAIGTWKVLCRRSCRLFSLADSRRRRVKLLLKWIDYNLPAQSFNFFQLGPAALSHLGILSKQATSLQSVAQ